MNRFNPPGRPPTNCPERLSRASLAQLYIRDEVLEATARVPLRGRWGRTYCYVACVWDRLVAAHSPVSTACTLEDLKAWLPRAHRAGLVRLSKAPLLEVLCPSLLSASEVPGPGGSTWHFLFDPASDPFSS